MRVNKKMDSETMEALYDELNHIISKFDIPVTDYPRLIDGRWHNHAGDFHGDMRDLVEKFSALMNNPRVVHIENPDDGDWSAIVKRSELDADIAVGDAVLAISKDLGEVATIVISVDDDNVVLKFPEGY